MYSRQLVFKALPTPKSYRNDLEGVDRIQAYERNWQDRGVDHYAFGSRNRKTPGVQSVIAICRTACESEFHRG